MPGRVGRPSIGPKIDFRVPPEVERAVRNRCRATGEQQDPLYREMVLLGFAALGLDKWVNPQVKRRVPAQREAQGGERA